MKHRLFREALVLQLVLILFGSAPAADPVDDIPFIQEYRDPFIQAKTREENDVRAVTVDSAGHIWAATAAGIRRVEKEKFVEPSGDRIDGPAYYVDLDSAGTIWVGAWNGVYRITDGAVRREGKMEFTATAVAPFDKRLLAGGPQGVHKWIGGQWRPVPGNWATGPMDFAIADGQLHVATWSGVYRRKGDATDRLSKRNELLSRNVRALAVAPDGALWIGSRGGLDVYRKGQRTASFTGREGLPSTDVSSLAFDKDGRLWVGTALGAARFDGKQWSLRHSKRWLPNDDVRDVAFASDGTAVVATGDGISVIRRRKMTLADKADHYSKIVRSRHVRAPGLVERCRLRTPGDVSTWEPMDTDNDGMYTGLYLVAEAHRYAVTGAADARTNATEAYRALEFLQTVTETPGFVARTVVPADWTRVADANRTYTPEAIAEHRSHDARAKIVELRWRKSRDGKWLWKGDTSSDELTGHFFAYAAYYDLVADDAEKQRVAEHVRRIIDYIIEGGYVLRDIDGTATRWAVWSPEKT